MQSESYEGRPTRLGPGEGIDPDTGQVLYSAAWLNNPQIVLDSPPRRYDVRVSVSPAREPVHDDGPPGLVLFTEVRVAAASEHRALKLAARGLLGR